ncbi:S1C family serine protease [Salsuginibacillus kocurii]|uniref:S1C family serine protease n=1 Tax=Salsuginibacillus kocurii TaxID=427078 RepID=UPI0003820674|nr:serine protease [Salsuginibacillus kocurii]
MFQKDKDRGELDEDLMELDPDEQPDPEDFLPSVSRSDTPPRKKRPKRTGQRPLVKLIALGIAFLLVFRVLAVALDNVSLQAFDFMETSQELSGEEEVQAWKQSIVTLQGQGPFSRTSGTGFIIEDSGLIVTNQHVVEDLAVVAVETYDGEMHQGEIISMSDDYDLAFLTIDANNLPTLPLAEENGDTGDVVYVIGNPLAFTRVANEGQVISSSEEETLVTAPIYSGNSGSPVINEDGEVVAVIFASRDSGNGSHGVAVSVEQVREDMPQAAD